MKSFHEHRGKLKKHLSTNRGGPKKKKINPHKHSDDPYSSQIWAPLGPSQK